MPDDDEKQRKKMEQVVAYGTIPFVLGVPPIIGWFLGSWLDKYFNTAPILMYVLLVLGFVAGVRECYRIIFKYQNGGDK